MKHSDVTNEICVDVTDSGFVSNYLQITVKDLSGINPMTTKVSFSVEEAENLANDILQKVKAFKDSYVKEQLLDDILKSFDLEREVLEGRNWIAVDADGTVYAYNVKPKHSLSFTDMWTNNGEVYTYLGNIREEAVHSNMLESLWVDAIFNINEVLGNNKHLDSGDQKEEFKKHVLRQVDLEKEFFKGRNWIAVDANGCIYTYNHKPRVVRVAPNCWTGSGDNCSCVGQVDVKQYKDFKNLWEGSLIEISEYMYKQGYCVGKEQTYQLFGLPFKINVKKAIKEGFTHLAVDRSGAMYIYKGKPSFSCTQWKVSRGTHYQKLHKFSPDQVSEKWRGSCVSLQDLLERRCYKV